MDAAQRPNPFVPVLLAWLVPGAGHFALRRPWPGLFVAAAILPLFGAGLVLAGFENVSWERHPWYFGLQVFTGLPAGAAALLTRTTVLTEPLAHRTVGDLFTCVAGLLNIVALADVWARCSSGDPEERLVTPDEEEPEEDGGVRSLLREESPSAAAVPPASGAAADLPPGAPPAAGSPPRAERTDG